MGTENFTSANLKLVWTRRKKIGDLIFFRIFYEFFISKTSRRHEKLANRIGAEKQRISTPERTNSSEVTSINIGILTKPFCNDRSTVRCCVGLPGWGSGGGQRGGGGRGPSVGPEAGAALGEEDGQRPREPQPPGDEGAGSARPDGGLDVFRPILGRHWANSHDVKKKNGIK